MTTSTEIETYDEAVQAYLAWAEQQGAHSPNQPTNDETRRTEGDDGWTLYNVNGDIAHVYDSGEIEWAETEAE